MLEPGGPRSRPAPGISAVPGSARLVVEREAEAIVAALKRVRMSGSAHGTPHGRPRGQVPRVRVVTVFVPSRCEMHSVTLLRKCNMCLSLAAMVVRGCQPKCAAGAPAPGRENKEEAMCGRIMRCCVSHWAALEYVFLLLVGLFLSLVRLFAT